MCANLGINRTATPSLHGTVPHEVYGSHTAPNRQDRAASSRKQVIGRKMPSTLGLKMEIPAYFPRGWFAPEAFSEPQQLLAAFFNSSTVGLAILDRQLRFQAANGALAKMSGVPAGAHLGKTAQQIFGDLEPLEVTLQHVLATTRPALDVDLSGRLPKRAEVGHWIGNFFPIKDGSGKVKQIGTIVVEVTNQKKLEKSLHSLTARLLQIKDDEQRRIARELHDSLGQYYVRLKMNLDVLSRTELEPDDKAELFAQSMQVLDRCISETRTISYLLHPPLLDEAGLASAVRWYVDGLGQRSGIKVNLYVQQDLGRLPEKVEMGLFRVLQESATNVHRHANSPALDIRLGRKSDQVTLEVRDYGRGIQPAQLKRFQETNTSGGVGLAGMRERIHELGGWLDVRSDKGTIVTAKIPLTRSRKKSITRQHRKGKSAKSDVA